MKSAIPFPDAAEPWGPLFTEPNGTKIQLHGQTGHYTMQYFAKLNII